MDGEPTDAQLLRRPRPGCRGASGLLSTARRRGHAIPRSAVPDAGGSRGRRRADVRRGDRLRVPVRGRPGQRDGLAVRHRRPHCLGPVAGATARRRDRRRSLGPPVAGRGRLRAARGADRRVPAPAAAGRRARLPRTRRAGDRGARRHRRARPADAARILGINPAAARMRLARGRRRMRAALAAEAPKAVQIQGGGR